MDYSILFKIIKDMLVVFLGFLKIPFLILAGILVFFMFLIGINVIVNLLQGKRLQKGTSKQVVKKRGILRKLFIDFPKRFVDDIFERDPDFFPYQGLIIFEGRQGNGKTISAIQCARQMQKEYLKCKCITNLNYAYEDDELDHWSKLIDYKNGILGVIAVLDETQNWFSSNQSKNFPPEMLQVITQNRKNRRVILGTAQNFYLLAKAIRSQTTEIRRCTTFFGCLTLVRKFEPILNSEGAVEEFKKRGWYFFIHDKDLRESYDTYHVINSLKESGFKDNADILSNDGEIINSIMVINQNIKKK